MIPRYQRILFWVLLLGSVAMAVVVLRVRERAIDRVSGRSGEATTQPAPEPAAPEESVILYEANDLDGSIAPVTRGLALPKETGARARVLLGRLLADYATPGSGHPLTAGPGVEAVFFMPLDPASSANSSAGDDRSAVEGSQQVAVIDLAGSFAANHPSGVEVETLTLLSMIETLEESFPSVRQVRFLVDGQPRESLAGHADLARTYIAPAGQS